MCAKKRHRTNTDFLRYLKDDLSKQERHELERDLEADPFEKEAMKGLESVSPEKAEEDILSLHASLGKRLGRRKRVAWYSIAATAASILIVGTIFLNIYDLNPEQTDREVLTEETFRSLDSDDEKSGLIEETPMEEAPIKEAPAETFPGKPAQQESSNENASRAPEPIPAQARKVSPPVKREREQDLEIAEDLVVMEYSVADETRAEIVVDDEIVIEPEPAAKIGFEEAAPGEKSRLAKKGRKSLRPENLPSPAPTREVSGIVVSSEDMDPLPGASIVIRGSNSGTVADMEGRFTLPADDNQTTVVASFIGMETGEYQLDSEGDNQLVMQPDPMTLDEVVVVAQGSGRLAGISSMSVNDVQMDETTPSYTPAEPLDGYRALKKYMEQNMVFPSDYIPGEREMVILRFTVQATGSIADIQTLRSPGDPYTLEAIRLISEGPKWTPARMNSGPIEEQVRVRIVFKK